jgi:hypothetical protein
VKTFPVPRRESEGTIRYILVNDRATRGWLANLANLEIHPFLHRAPNIDNPTTIEGYLHIHVNGQKLNGDWTLVRRRTEGEREK